MKERRFSAFPYPSDFLRGLPIASKTAIAAAHATGLPPNVPPSPPGWEASMIWVACAPASARPMIGGPSRMTWREPSCARSESTSARMRNDENDSPGVSRMRPLGISETRGRPVGWMIWPSVSRATKSASP